MAGLYLHIPFCRARCHYCDFTTYAGMEQFMPAYVAALAKEVRRETRGFTPETIFIGGGTPTALDDDSFALLMAMIRPLVAGEGQEVTLEANPESLTPEKVRLMKRGGINRVSLGLQSTDDLILKNSGRIHNYARFLESYGLLRQEGFQNLNLDLITALPGQDEEIILDTLLKVIALKPEHISVYSLILEEGTPFHRLVQAGRLKLPEEETELAYQELAQNLLSQAGYQRYEISNYALPGRESRHNLNYWNLGEYIGCGVAAAGFRARVRTTNVPSIEDYIAQMERGESVRAMVHVNTREDSMEEFVFLGLRKRQGISTAEFRERFQVSFAEVYGSLPQRFLHSGLLIQEGDRLRLSQRGFDISNSIMADFILTGEGEA